jgi:hypothetical protein
VLLYCVNEAQYGGIAAFYGGAKRPYGIGEATGLYEGNDFIHPGIRVPLRPQGYQL